MEIALTVTYLWAGVTVAFALWHFETIGEALNELHPAEFSHKHNMRGNPWVVATIVIGWPIVLPAWLVIAWKERSNGGGQPTAR